MSTVLEIKALSYTIKGKDIVSLKTPIQINAGDVVRIEGPNGSGKSTFVNHIRRIKMNHSKLKDDYNVLHYTKEGKEIDIGSLTLNELSYYRNRIAVLDQENTPFKQFTILEALLYPVIVAFSNEKGTEGPYDCPLHHKDRQTLKKEAQTLIDQNLAPQNDDYDTNIGYNTKLSKLSGGQIRLVEILMVLFKAWTLGIRLVILDEPFNHLDESNQEMVEDFLQKMVDKTQKQNLPPAILVVSHKDFKLKADKKITIEKDGIISSTI